MIAALSPPLNENGMRSSVLYLIVQLLWVFVSVVEEGHWGLLNAQYRQRSLLIRTAGINVLIQAEGIKHAWAFCISGMQPQQPFCCTQSSPPSSSFVLSPCMAGSEPS